MLLSTSPHVTSFLKTGLGQHQLILPMEYENNTGKLMHKIIIKHMECERLNGGINMARGYS